MGVVHQQYKGCEEKYKMVRKLEEKKKTFLVHNSAIFCFREKFCNSHPHKIGKIIMFSQQLILDLFVTLSI